MRCGMSGTKRVEFLAESKPEEFHEGVNFRSIYINVSESPQRSPGTLLG